LPIDTAILAMLRPYRLGLPTSACVAFLPTPQGRPRWSYSHVRYRLCCLEAQGVVRRDEHKWWWVVRPEDRA
jgi:hypothetical protein